MSSSVCNAVATVLDHLESGERLQMPNLMRRIRDLLTKRLLETDSCVTHVPHEEDWGDSPNTDHLSRFKDAVRNLETKDSPLYVDVQYLMAHDRTKVVKEFSAESADGTVAWITVKSPVGVRPNVEENEYVGRHLNGLTWDCGLIEWEDLRSWSTRLFNGRRLYVKGDCKIAILMKNFNVPHRYITDLWHLPKLQTMRSEVTMGEECPYHGTRRRLACAKLHTRAMVVSHN